MPKEVFSPKLLSRRVTVFRNGRNQAIRIPRDFEFQADEVILEKEGDRLIVQPVNREPSLFDVLAANIKRAPGDPAYSTRHPSPPRRFPRSRS